MITESIEIIKYKEGDLIQYNLHGSSRLRYGKIKEDAEHKVTNNDKIIDVWRQDIIDGRLAQNKGGVYSRNIHKNFGQVQLKDFMAENPEYFI